MHIHFPLGAVRKDGPSGGIAIAAALVSKSLGVAMKEGYAMTGEISLSGQVLRIGGLKEKVLAARREGIENVIIPAGNASDWEELPEKVKEGVRVHMVREFEEVARVLFP